MAMGLTGTTAVDSGRSRGHRLPARPVGAASLPSGTSRPRSTRHAPPHAISNPGPTADVDCYTCRRRRVRCDRALPTCRKCTKAGHQCAGYKKGFRWVGGIASRGKMMGKSTFHDEEAMTTEESKEEEKDESSRSSGQVNDERQLTEMVLLDRYPQLHNFPRDGVTVDDTPLTTTAPLVPYGCFNNVPSGEYISGDGVDFVEAALLIPCNASIACEDPAQQLLQDAAEQPTEVAMVGEELDFESLPLVSSAASETPLTSPAEVAASWAYYFSTSSNYEYSRARSGICYRVVPNGTVDGGYGQQYILNVRVPSSPRAEEISIARLIDFYVSTPSAAPTMIAALDDRARYYLSYFDQMSGIFLLFDRHPLNPYREILLSTLYFHEPALLSTLLAVAARYHANVTGYNYSEDGLGRPDLVYYNQALNYLNQDLQDEERMLEDTTLASVLFFLFYETMDSGLDTWRVHLSGARKLVELKMKRMEMQPCKLSHIQAFLLHSIALFDIIGSTLATDRSPSVLAILPSSPPAPSTSSSSSQTAHPPSACTAISPASSTAEALHNIDTDIYPILVQGEMFCFLACPPEILQIILKITILSSHPYLQSLLPQTGSASSTSTYTTELQGDFFRLRAEVLHMISSFSPTPWLVRHQQDLTMRSGATDLYHHVEAYKTAVLIYLYRSLFPPSDNCEEGDVLDISSTSTTTTFEPTIADTGSSVGSSTPSTPDTTNSASCFAPSMSTAVTQACHTATDFLLQRLTIQLFAHLDQIPISSTLYKGTVWPCFIAGTEARTPEQRDKIRMHFDRLWDVLYCWNVRNGIRVLEELWRNGVGEGEEGEDKREGIGIEGEGHGDGGSGKKERRKGKGKGKPDWKAYLKRKGWSG
ncbi:fungal-specific transcription factor domain-containing protein [Kalaharituber pfeilii]|nr:fungal-specific transcription factor domain-containing protein [Kalaharituber pfeilii]